MPASNLSTAGSSSGRQNGERAIDEALAVSMAMTIGAESGAATGPIPVGACRQEGPRLERPGASLETQGDSVAFCHPAFVQL